MISTLYEKFQHWSRRGSVYLISDPHFGDNDCIYMDPNWISADEYLKKINSIVHKDDTLICLGDCGDLSYISRINAGYKVLITGNHDDKGLSTYHRIFTKEEYDMDRYSKKEVINIIKEKYPHCKFQINELCRFHSPFEYYDVIIDNGLFDEVYNGPLFIADRILLSHEPIYGLEDICMNICGHVHDWDKTVSHRNHICLASNIVNWNVFSLGELINYGMLADTQNYHRVTIDRATKKKYDVNKSNFCCCCGAEIPEGDMTCGSCKLKWIPMNI